MTNPLPPQDRLDVLRAKYAAALREHGPDSNLTKDAYADMVLELNRRWLVGEVGGNGDKSLDSNSKED